MSNDPFGDRIRAAAAVAEVDDHEATAAYVAGVDEPVEREVRAHVLKGWSIESQTPAQAVVRKGRRPNHVLHLLLSLVTFGVWLVVWLVLALAMGEKRHLIVPDGAGGADVRAI